MKKLDELFGYEGGFVGTMEKIFDIVSLSAMYLLGCIPIVTIGVSAAALYDTLQRNMKDGRGYPVREFWASFRRNLKPGILLWLVIGGLTFLLELNLGIAWKAMEGNLQIFCLIFYCLLLVLVTGARMYAFPALSRFDMPVGWLLKLSVYLCFRRLPRTLLLAAVYAASLALIYWCWPLMFLLPFLACSACGYFLEPVLREHMPK